MKRIIFSIGLSFCLTSLSFAASKESDVKKGNALYQRGEFEASLKNYQDALKDAPESAAVNFNLGTALYKSKKYGDAIPYLQKGLLSDDADVKKNAHFNLGDALFASGLEMERQNTDQAIKNLEESIRQFNTVMNLDDKDVDARYNQNIVQKELERLKKKQEQQKQEKKNNDQKQDQNQQQQQDQQNKDQSDKGSSQSGQQDQKDQETPQQSAQSEGDKKDEDKPRFKPDGRDSDGQDQKDQSRQNQYLKPSQKETNGGEMSKEEAKNLLRDFEQNEQPAGLLNFGKNISQDHPVLKDW